MSEYRVLARKYRPTNFDDLIGQDVLVRTLSNAIKQNRLAHAFLLTGIRGIGKTTTARIIAKGLNCIGADGNGSATIHPCGECSNCIAITQDRHVDVLEMDAASRTGVDDIRDILETVHYAPANARYKIYIIDEVHMLSKNAFNALLKTLEEPPPHVKFIFATTELRKIPITILSRCQKFDLKRIERDELAEYLNNICNKEAVNAEPEALKLIASAAEGSVRDSLSLLDQAIAHAGATHTEATYITAQNVAGMLGLSDKEANYNLLSALFSGQISSALTLLREQYTAGGDPLQILQELLGLLHQLTLLKTESEQISRLFISLEQQQILQSLAQKLPLTLLTRGWQVVLKGLTECQQAPNPLIAAEMVLIRLGYLTDLPSPDELIRRLNATSPEALASYAPAPNIINTSILTTPPLTPVATLTTHSTATNLKVASSPRPALEPHITPSPISFEEVLRLFEEKKELILHRYLERETSVVQFQTGYMELNFSAVVPAEIPGKISQKLTEWTGERWIISLSQAAGSLSHYMQKKQLEEEQLTAMKQQPLVNEAISLFPGAAIIKIETGE